MGKFWDDLMLGSSGGFSPLDAALNQRSQARSSSVRLLTDKGRSDAGLPLPAAAGTRVAFADNLGAIFSYEDPPGGLCGTVVTVRTATGEDTSLNGSVFVKWDDGRFLPVHREHLRLASTKSRTASLYRRVVASLGDLDDFLKVAGVDDLIHKATKDLWSVNKVGDEYVIARLFDETGTPLKV